MSKSLTGAYDEWTTPGSPLHVSERATDTWENTRYQRWRDGPGAGFRRYRPDPGERVPDRGCVIVVVRPAGDDSGFADESWNIVHLKRVNGQWSAGKTIFLLPVQVERIRDTLEGR